MAKPSGSHFLPSARGTSSSTPRPTIFSLVFSMPPFCAPALVTVAAVVAVPHVVVVKNVTEAVPLRAALQRHDDDVVGAADFAVIEHARIRIGAGARHQVNRIEAAQRGIFRFAALRPALVVVERERNDFAFLARVAPPRRCLPGVVKFSVPISSFFAPASPVLAAFRRLLHVLARELAIARLARVVLARRLSRHCGWFSLRHFSFSRPWRVPLYFRRGE